MTARASTPEHVCSSCRALVLRACGAADLADRPSCSSCSRIVCEACELAGLCPGCFAQVWARPVEADDDEHCLVVVGGSSLPGLRPEVAAQLFAGGADDSPR